MPADQFVLLAIGLAVIAAIAVTVAYATSHAAGRVPSTPPPDPSINSMRYQQTDPTDPASSGDPATAPATGTIRTGSIFVTPASTRQVARVVAFLFLASVAVVVALTGAWQDQQAAIFTLLAAGTLLVVLFMDMIPPSALGRWRRPAEGIGAIIFLGLLMALTGGVGSPFFVGFFLVVAGTALSTEGMAPLAIALVAAATIALVGFVVSFDSAIGGEGLAWVGFNAVALILLADIATAAARAQRHARDEALRASRFDALTGLYNRSFFFTTMEQEIRRSDRMGRGFTMLMLDLDDLKPVNDTFGHQWGDRLLKAIADVVRHTIRFTDAAARYGGDEFVVLLPETDAPGGYVVGEKLRRDIAALTLHAADRNVRSSVSVGLVTYPDDGTTIEQLVAAADVAMYEAKRRGKNRIVGYQTRMERVATAIDADSAQLVQLTPTGDVRTGGDPAPWGGTEGNADTGARVSYGERPIGETRLESPGRRRYDDDADFVEAIPIEPDPASSDARPSTDPTRAPWDEPAPPRPSTPSDPPPPPPPPTRVADADAYSVERPWLTRTDQQTQRPDDAPPRRPADDAPPRRPAADARAADQQRSDDSAPGYSGREPSRSDEIRSTGERPWIALPIEPYDPPERPKG